MRLERDNFYAIQQAVLESILVPVKNAASTKKCTSTALAAVKLIISHFGP